MNRALRHLLPALLSVASVLVPVPVTAAPSRTHATAVSHHSLRDLRGGSLTLAAFNGHVVVLNFWASWCGPCRKELPRLAALDAELSKLGGRVVAISIDADVRNAADFATRHAPGMALFHDGPDGLVRSLDVPALPYTYVLDRDGRVVWSGGGADKSTLLTIAEQARRLASAPEVAARSVEGSAR